MARHKRFTDKAGFTRHCWECVHSYDWDEHVGFCDVYVNSVEKYDSPNNCSTIAGGCDYYSDGKEPEPESDAGGAFDERRYSKVCRLLEEALSIMSEWGCKVDE